ncbi:DUF1810 domain-containing protein [Rufibacter latericius]|uniref:DUF1810 domain-containing protein n=1 Tax=Rufibacter latericius TaxID=2487040 RepID=A0A3M9MAX2_9BACT|nr:DUF1810 domain-containing protein [Rufibacter latericius]RNI22666.1 DUF1810 domain-containing protein [Rufibacter latericius]
MKENGLQRFLSAQERDYEVALSEIRKGRKQSHWMWYIFPQMRGLGFSETSVFYGIKDVQEAEAYLKHPVLGSRLVEICEALLKLEGNNACRIFGSPDDLKLKSSMTLFASLPNANPVFRDVLQKFFHGKQDEKTLQILHR